MKLEKIISGAKFCTKATKNGVYVAFVEICVDRKPDVNGGNFSS